MNVLIALDSFKGSLPAATACRLAAESVVKVMPGATVHSVPMADGGEGTAEALVGACAGGFVEVTGVHGPLPGQRVTARYGWLPQSRTAVIEMAQASGLTLVPSCQRDPSLTTTRGTGELVVHALRRGAGRVVLTLGGSATNDGGTGAATALGWRFLDADGRDLPPGGGALSHLRRIVAPPEGRPGVPVEALCDVDNPLSGPRGAAAVYGPQKGATAALVQELDAGLQVLARCIRDDLGIEVDSLPGAGAAGGFGAGAVAFLGARLTPGVETVAELVGLPARLRTADWVVTGEGRFDDQSLQGKVVSGILRQASRWGTRVAVLAGSVSLDPAAWRAAGILEVEACAPAGMAAEDAMRRASELLQAAMVRLAERLA